VYPTINERFDAFDKRLTVPEKTPDIPWGPVVPVIPWAPVKPRIPPAPV
jgi:hypothetical protein